jgi:hypothetical protein
VYIFGYLQRILKKILQTKSSGGKICLWGRVKEKKGEETGRMQTDNGN